MCKLMSCTTNFYVKFVNQQLLVIVFSVKLQLFNAMRKISKLSNEKNVFDIQSKCFGLFCSISKLCLNEQYSTYFTFIINRCISLIHKCHFNRSLLLYFLISISRASEFICSNFILF